MIFRNFFFYYEGNEGVGFEHFGSEHLCIIALGAAVIVLVCFRYSRADDKTQRRMDKTVGFWVLVIIYALRNIYYFVVGVEIVTVLPLHLCSISGFLCMAHTIRQKEWIGQVLYALCLPGTFCAILYSDWTYFPAFSFISLQAYIYHFAIPMYIIMQLISRSIIPDIRKIWTIAVFMAVIVPSIHYFNYRNGTNYMFLNYPSPDSPLVPLADKFGNPGYILPYFIGVWCVIIVMILAGMLVFKYRSVKQLHRH